MSQHRKSLECPFTWTLDENLAHNLDEANELYVDVGEEPVLALVNSIMLTYCRAIKGEYSAAKIKNKETEEIWDKLDVSQIQNENISTKVLEHVKQATAYHVLHLSGDSSEADLIMDALTDSQSLNSPLDQSTLEGCKSIAWLSFHEAGHEFALRHAEKASSASPNCALWHFLRAKSNRYARRHVEFSWKPRDEERQAFLRCRELSSRPFYAIFVAQMHRENRDREACRQMYLDIYEDCLKKSETVCVGVLLRLALAFTRRNDFTRANECLERVQKIKPKGSMFLHYKGIYLMKMKDFKMAKVYLEEAAKVGNYIADMDLMTCNKRLDANFDCIGHLQKMVDKYGSDKYRKMQSLLHIAMQYYYNKKDYVTSAEYFKQAIDLDIKSQQLKDFRNSTIDWKDYNIFNFVCDKLLPELRVHSSNSSVDSQKILNYLKTRCEPGREAQADKLARSFDTMKLRYYQSDNL